MVMKLAYSEARQRFGEVCLRALDREALHVDDNEYVEERLRTLALTIAAGSSQIQRNIIGEMVLGLPKEPKATEAGRVGSERGLPKEPKATEAGRVGSERGLPKEPKATEAR
jgi:hypothetical protein